MSDSESESEDESGAEEQGEQESVEGEEQEKPRKPYERIYGSPHISETEIQNVLTEEDAGDCLERIGQVFEGGAYAFIKMNASNRNLNEISVITNYKHVMFVDVSSNRLSIDDLTCLTEMEHLIGIHAEKNRITTISLPPMKHLQYLSFNHNYIRSTELLVQSNLVSLELNYNQLKEVVGLNQDDIPLLVNLELRGNSLRTLDGINFSTLISLYIAENFITTLIGIDRMVNLKTLHVRNNPIVDLDGFSDAMTKIEYINLRECGIIDLEQFRKLSPLLTLKNLVVSQNPFNEDAEEDYRVGILVFLPNLKRIDKTNVDIAELDEAKERRQGEDVEDEEESEGE